MSNNLQFLPIEIQTSVAELRALGTPEHALSLLVDRILKASEAKVTSLQMSIVQIEESITLRLDRVADKIQSDLHTQLGATNAMLIELHQTAQGQEAATAQLRDEFQTFGESVIGRVELAEEHIGALAQRVAAHDQSRDQSIADRRMLREDMDASKTHRAQIQTTLDRMDRRLLAIEQLLAVADETEADT